MSRVNPLGRRFASINCYYHCLTPGNTEIRPSSALASSLRSAPAEFTRTTSHRVAQGYRRANGIVLVSGTQAPGVRVGTAPTGRARPRTPPGGRPHQPNGSAGIAVLGSPASCHWHRTASRRSLPSPAQSAAAGSSADDAARNASDGRCSSADCGMGVTSQFIHANTPVVFYLYLDASL